MNIFILFQLSRKVTERLCRIGFSPDKFLLSNKQIWTIFFVSPKKNSCLELKTEKFFDYFSYSYGELKIASLDYLGQLKRDIFLS